jgi:hypothetical protein
MFFGKKVEVGMSKKSLFLSCLVVLAFSANSFATLWNGSAGDGLWKTGGNWTGGSAPTTGNATFYYYPGQSVTIDSGTAATCAVLEGLGWYGNTNQGVLTIQANGSLTATVGVVLGQGGPSKLILDGGTLNASGSGVYFQVGNDSAGVFQMNSGTATMETLYVTIAGGSGHVQLDGGTLTVNNWMSMNANGKMDIKGGKLVIPWASLAWMQTTYQPLIDAGQITGYGDKTKAAIGYTEGVGAYLYAVPEPMTLSLLGLGALALIRRK